MTHAPGAAENGQRNKRVKSTVHKIVREYLEGRSATACMDELVKIAIDSPVKPVYI